MNYRRLGKSGLKLSELSLGAWVTYGGQVGENVAYDCMKAAWEAGVGSPKSVNPKHQTPKWGRWSAQQQAFRNFCGEEMQACSHSMQDAIGADAQRVDDRSIRGN